ncbi:hypothetical protein [Mycolicibacterium sarraceniae]|uniref:Uncharacterized protein n=1 Tax=Mycolicibacterium sarraceniae TaxID=1534348 RepID=A0A7I7SK37_9MYCO|nr:hypothetical protein [Mycolicibacterium sarraceniae]BBY57128.1 hypothetical protein MSAR_02640 [Mycolicibacterium sarraceniae]
MSIGSCTRGGTEIRATAGDLRVTGRELDAAGHRCHDGLGVRGPVRLSLLPVDDRLGGSNVTAVERRQRIR